MLEQLISRVKENMLKKGKSSKDIAITLYCIRKRYNNDEILNPPEVQVTPTYKEPTREERILQLQKHYEEEGSKTGLHVFGSSSRRTSTISKFGRTELHVAVANEDRKRIRELVKDGIDTSARDNSGYTAYQQALLNGDSKTINLFKRLGVKK